MCLEEFLLLLLEAVTTYDYAGPSTSKSLEL